MPYANPAKAKAYHRVYYLRNKSRIDQYRKTWSEKNPEKDRSYKRISNQRNYEDILEYRRIYALAFPEKTLANVKRYQSRHPELIKQRARDYRKANPDKVRASKSKWQRRRKETDLNFRIKCNLRNRVHQALFHKRAEKSDGTMTLLGCSIPEFRIYLESLFEEGMSWSNYGKGHGKWQIDHTMPCAIFDLTKREHQKRCFHFSNQKPMWQPENCRKGRSVVTNQFQLL